MLRQFCSGRVDVSASIPAAGAYMNAHTGRDMTPQTYSVEEAATVIGVSDKLLWRVVHSGHIVHIRIGRAYRVPCAEVERVLRDGLNVPTTSLRPARRRQSRARVGSLRPSL
jgi:excisionase family DNA binding protein